MLGDDRLAALAATGDRRAFSLIYERHHQALYRYCRSMLGSDADARDAVQNAMVSALRALDGERREIALKPWLYRIAHNEAMNVIRRRRGEAPLEAAEQIVDHGGADHATRERLRELVGDLGQLPEQQRGALVMRELSGLGYEEIGAALGISAASATRAVYDARQGLHAFSEGRSMDCDSVRELISANDRRSLRARKVRGHLRACAPCAGFDVALRQRPGDLALLAPALPAAGAASLLQGIFGGANGAGSGGGALGAATAAAQTATTWGAIKAVAVTATVAAAGAGGVHAGTTSGVRDDAGTRAGARHAVSPASATAAKRGSVAGGREGTSTDKDARRPGGAARPEDRRRDQHPPAATGRRRSVPGPATPGSRPDSAATIPGARTQAPRVTPTAPRPPAQPVAPQQPAQQPAAAVPPPPAAAPPAATAVPPQESAPAPTPPAGPGNR